MIHIDQLDSTRTGDAAGLFVGQFADLRGRFPVLSDTLEKRDVVAEKLARMRSRSLIATENGQPLGFLAWWEIDQFRGSARRGAYVPEWAHGAVAGRRAEVYAALYRVASADWAAAGCGVHAITVLANDQEAREAWFWNGFGLAVVDAVRPVTLLDPAPRCDLAIHQATRREAELLHGLDAEHVKHYAAAPVYMAPPHVDSAPAFAEFVERPRNSVWLAMDRSTPAGFMRFTGDDFDAVAALQSDAAAFCNGAYVCSQHRGRGVGQALLQAALAHYQGVGLTGLFTNFESFNPEAARFWPRYFEPVCLSLMRVPEVLPQVYPGAPAVTRPAASHSTGNSGSPCRSDRT